MSTAALSVRQFRFELRTLLRNRTALIFTLAFPLIFVLIFGAGTKGNTETFDGHKIPAIQFFIPGIMTYGIIGTSYTSLAMRLSQLRDQGILKRVAGTPLPRAAYVAGQILNSVVLGLFISALVLLLGKFTYGVHIYASTLAAVVVTVIFGSVCFCALGIAVASVIPNADAATGVVQFSILPVILISDVFYSIADGPKWLADVASFLPVRHLANSLQLAFDPRTNGAGFDGHDLIIMAVWAAVGTFYSVRHFRWESSKS
jgi:ABC-2 type transport system permease protein